MRKYVTEFIGTFGLVFTFGCAAWKADGLAPIATGAVLAVLIYFGAPVSGAHFNPAVTLGVFLRGKLPFKEAWAYCAAQLVAAFGAAWTARFVASPGKVSALSISGGHAVLGALLAELIFTFALVYVMLNVATGAQPGNQFLGLAAGLTFMAGGLAVGSVSGGAFNPAIAFGASLMGLLGWSNLWIYLIAELLAAVAAAIAFGYLNPGDDASEGPLAKLPKISLPRISVTKPSSAT